MSFTRSFIVSLVVLFWTFSGSGLFAQSTFLALNSWETLPVFHNGRVMPLHTCAKQIVREICGTERPFIIRDDSAINDFNQVIEAFQRQENQDTTEQEEVSTGYIRFLNPNAGFDGGFDRQYSPYQLAGDVPQIKTVLPIQGLNRPQIERLANRIKQLVPPEGRYFYADELLFSWICEPEIWAYIPIFLVPETDYLTEIFGMSVAGDMRTSQHRISVYRLENSQRYQQRYSEIQRLYELGQIAKDPIRYNQITERIADKVQTFRELTFHPQRQRPTRMLSLLRQTIDGQSSYFSAFNSWGYLLSLGEIPVRQATERSSNPDELTVFHPTTQRWHNIADKLRFLMQVYARTDSVGNPVVPRATIVERHYEILIDLVDTNLAEAAVLMESVYPDVPYRVQGIHVPSAERLLPTLKSPENQQSQAAIRQLAMRYYYSVKKLRQEIEAAYLALYDNGRSIRFLPLRSPQVLEMGSSANAVDVQPWASASMILGSGETFVKRFLDPQLDTLSATLSVPRVEDSPPSPSEEASSAALDATNDSGLDALLGSLEDTKEPETNTNIVGEPLTDIHDPLADSHTDPNDPALLDQLLFQPLDMRDGILRLGQADQSLIGTIRTRLRDVLASYQAQTGIQYASADFILRAEQFQQTIRQAVERIDTHRKPFVDGENQQTVDLLNKTAYPDAGSLRKLLAEYRYDRIQPFYWMGVFALIALILNGATYITAFTRDQSAVGKTIAIHSSVRGKEEGTELLDYTNTIEEWLFIGSVVMLIFSILTASIGGIMRASITGWAPVTNMYETVVMMALAAAILGVWYALSPLLHPALQQAWVYSKFPRLGTLLEWFAAVKAHKAAVSSHETAGEAAMREAAEDFGVPGGVTALGRHQIPSSKTDTAQWEAQQRVQAAQRKMTWQYLLALPRLILTFITFYTIVLLANGADYVADNGFVTAANNMFSTNDTVDALTVAVSVFLMIWIIPHGVLALFIIPAVLFRPAWIASELGIQSFETKIVVESVSQTDRKPQSVMPLHSEMGGVFHGEKHHGTQDSSGAAWLKQARNATMNRKLFIAITAGIVFIVALIAMLNKKEFNPDIRPIAAVLRSNFWLAVHVSAIIVSYAAAFIAWGLAAVSLGFVVFGRYQRSEPTFEGQRTQILLPEPCQMFSPVIERLIKIALLMLIVGTVLGARWADYSWGRFWSWDPKEVWALITVIFFVIILHGKAARYYGAIGITVGALFASIAVIITWYGINFVFVGSVHAYGGGAESNAKFFLGTFMTANLLWGTLALLRYNAEIYGNEAVE